MLQKISPSFAVTMADASEKETTPASHLLEEIEQLRQHMRICVARYADTLEVEIGKLEKAVRHEAEKGSEKNPRMRDIRDMLIVLRRLDIKPEKGRRKDFKKIENALADLQLLSEDW